MNNETQKIRNEFLAQACRYLFGVEAKCCTGLPAMQPIPVRSPEHSRH